MAGQNANNSKEKINSLVKQFNSLDEREKNDFLQASNIYFLRFNNRPVAPPPELMPVVNQIGKLSFLCQMAMQRALTRRMDFKALEKVSEEQIRDNIVNQILPLLRDYTKDLEAAVFAQPRRAGKQQDQQNEQSQNSETANTPSKDSAPEQAPQADQDSNPSTTEPPKAASPTTENPLKKWASAE